MTDDEKIEKAGFELHMTCANTIHRCMVAFKYGAGGRDSLMSATERLRRALETAERAIAETAPPQDTHLTGRARIEQPWGER